MEQDDDPSLDSQRLADTGPEPESPESPPAALEQAAQALGPQGRQVFERVFALMSGQSQSPIWEKVTSEHLTDMLASRREESTREHTQWIYAHVTNTLIVAIVLLAGVALLFFALVADK